MNDDQRPACLDVDPEIFFPDAWNDHDAYNDARRVCTGCPVRQACLDGQMRAEGKKPSDARFGLWGGLDPVQRAALSRGSRGGRLALYAAAGMACGDRQGTPAGYDRHLRRKQTACDACRTAHNAHAAELKVARDGRGAA